MSTDNWLVTKLRAIVVKGPSVLRNMVLARLNYWPVDNVDGSDIQDVPTYCISLARATNKRELVRRQVERMGLSRFTFVDAIDARNLSLDALRGDGIYDDSTSHLYHAKGLTISEIACSLSHGAAYERMVADGVDVGLVIEDDALFVTRHIKRLKFVDVPSDFDVLFLNSFRSEEPPQDHVSGPVFGVGSYSGSAAAYLLSAKGIHKLLQAYRPVIHAADGLLGRCLELAQGEVHPFKQKGANAILRGYMTFPDCVLNGSTCHYHVSEVQPR